MPELPEVETVRKRLQEVLPGKTLVGVDIFHAKPARFSAEQITGRKILEVRRRSKNIIIDLEDDISLIVHLKMTGQLIFVDQQKKRVGGGHPNSDWTDNLPNSHTRLAFHTSENQTLFFNDQRIFGWVVQAPSSTILDLYTAYGPDANSEGFSLSEFQAALSKRSVPIKVAIMDAKIVAGVGNIYASESLWWAKILPLRKANSLSPTQVKHLYEAIKKVIAYAIELGGTTFDGKYVDIYGLTGKYQHELKVYGQQGTACQRCQTTILKIKQAGRSTFYCPNCQK